MDTPIFLPKVRALALVLAVFFVSSCSDAEAESGQGSTAASQDQTVIKTEPADQPTQMTEQENETLPTPAVKIKTLAKPTLSKRQKPSLNVAKESVAAKLQKKAASTFKINPLFPLSFKTKDYDFGKIPDTDDAVGTYEFQNFSDKTVIIEKTTVKCGCVAAPLGSQKSFAPGEAGTLSVRFDPRGRQGLQRKPITIHLIGGKTRTFSAVANIIPQVGVYPKSLWLGELSRDETTQFKTVTVISRIPSLKLSEGKLSDKRFEWKCLGTKIEDDEGGTPVSKTSYEIKFNGHDKIEQIRGSLIFATNDPKFKNIRIGLMVNVVGPLSIAPARMQLRMLDPGAEFTRTITVRMRDKDAGGFTLSNPVFTGLPEDMNIKTEFRPSKKVKGATEVVVTGIGSNSFNSKTGNSFRGFFTFETGLKKQPIVTIPVSGWVKLLPLIANKK